MHFVGSKVTEYWKTLPSTELMPKAVQLGVMVRNAKVPLSVAAGAGLSSPTPARNSSTQRLRSLFTQTLNRDYRFAPRVFKPGVSRVEINWCYFAPILIFLAYILYQCVFSLLSAMLHYSYSSMSFSDILGDNISQSCRIAVVMIIICIHYHFMAPIIHF